MPELFISTIVEGHGDVRALPILIRRLMERLAPQVIFKVPTPVRIPRGSFFQRTNEQIRSIELAALNCRDPNNSFILILFDSDNDCPAQLAPSLLESCIRIRSDIPMALTLAKREFESWFLAAAESLKGQRTLSPTLTRPTNPEDVADPKKWIRNNRSDSNYSETIDQPAYSAKFDLDEARNHAPSFDKFYRDFVKLLTPHL